MGHAAGAVCLDPGAKIPGARPDRRRAQGLIFTGNNEVLDDRRCRAISMRIEPR
jgi:hypothetical protein